MQVKAAALNRYVDELYTTMIVSDPATDVLSLIPSAADFGAILTGIAGFDVNVISIDIFPNPPKVSGTEIIRYTVERPRKNDRVVLVCVDCSAILDKAADLTARGCPADGTRKSVSASSHLCSARDTLIVYVH